MKKTLLSAMLSAYAVCSMAQADPITIDLGKRGTMVSPSLYGIFFEVINHATQQRRMFPIDALHPDVHDPVMAKGEDGRYYIFSTGMNVGVMSSADMKEWRAEPSALSETPKWAIDTVRGYRGHTWAPESLSHMAWMSPV